MLLVSATLLLGLVAGLLGERVAAATTPVPSTAGSACTGSALRTGAIAVVTALLLAATAWVIGASWVLPAYLWFVWVTVTLTITDLDAKLIPNRVLFPGTAVGLVLLGIGALGDGTPAAFGRAILGAAGAFLLLYLIARLARGDFGLGDVKLGFLIGLFTAYQGWAELVVGLLVAFALGGVVSLFLLATRMRRRKDAIPFGPYLVAGAYIGLATGQAIADWYLDG